MPLDDVGEKLIVPSLQTTCVIPEIRTIGFTVIVIVKADPGQLPGGEVGVTVYVAVC
jgi:hypothetical protein